MAGILSSSISALIPKDHRLTFTLLIAGTGALALFLDYFYKDRYPNGTKGKKLPGVSSKIESGNNKLEEAIRFYESALVDMQGVGVDDSERMQVRAMLLRAYEIQAILSPDEFKLRSSIMIEGVPSSVVQNILQDNLPELEAAGLPSLEDTPLSPLSSSPHPRSDSISSGGLSDFYEAFDFLEDEEPQADKLPAFFKDQLFLHKREEFHCRKNRFQQFNMSSPTEYLVKVQCIRLALDRLMRVPEKRSWMLQLGRNQTAKLLAVAGADIDAFSAAFDNLLDYVADLGNLAAIKEELKGRRVACVNVYDIVIDFCLLDSFDDLNAPPASVTSVIGNSWISQGIRKSMLSTAVWGLISGKMKKAKPDGFLIRFYQIMAVLTPSLAWGFLGDDPLLHPICMMIRNDTINSLEQIFDDSRTDYSSVDSLAEDLYSALAGAAARLRDELHIALPDYES